MFNLRLLIIGTLLLLSSGSLLTRSARAADPTDFMTEAIGLAQASQRETSVPAAVTLAQAIFETGHGRTPIGDANNYFGLKAFPRADGSINFGHIAIGWVWAWTKEWDGTRYVDTRARFRKYHDMADSFHDHGLLFVESARYTDAMQQVDDPKAFVRQIAGAGYATAPDYADSIIQLMDQQNLYQYDLRRDDAQFTDQSDYPNVEGGQAFQIYFEVKNTGFATWRQSDNYFLANDNGVSLGAPSRQELGAEVAPEGITRWTLDLSAPPTPGKYRTEWSLRHGDKTFGPGMYIDVTVVPPSPLGDAGQVTLLISSLALGGLGIRLWTRRHGPIIR